MKKDGMALHIFLCASFGSLVWLACFVLLSGFFEVKPEAKANLPTPTAAAENLPEVYPSGYYVLAVRNEQDEITRFFLQYTDFIRDALVFIRVPENTKLELSAGAYEVLSVHKPEMPKLFRVSELLSITSEELFCMAAEETAAGILGVRPKACYLFTEEDFAKLTEPTEQGIRFTRPEFIADTIRFVQKNSVNDRNLKDALVYAESYGDVREIYYRTLPGYAQGEEYRPDIEKIKEMTERFTAGLFEEPKASERKE